MHEARSEDGAATARSCRWQSLEINTLRRRWHAAAGPQKSVPPFEELALATPGGLAENVALLQVDGDGELKILTAGQAFEAWIGRPARGLKVAELSIDRARLAGAARRSCGGCTAGANGRLRSRRRLGLCL